MSQAIKSNRKERLALAERVTQIADLVKVSLEKITGFSDDFKDALKKLTE